MAMNFFVIYLSHKRLIVVKRDWIQSPVVRSSTIFFYSNNRNAPADFSLNTLYYVDDKVDACYKGFIVQGFGEFNLFYAIIIKMHYFVLTAHNVSISTNRLL